MGLDGFTPRVEQKLRFQCGLEKEKSDPRSKYGGFLHEMAATNNRVKESMALELAGLGLTQKAIERLLNMDLPFEEENSEEDIPF